MQPARSYSPARYIPGICAVSPPTSAHPPRPTGLGETAQDLIENSRLQFLGRRCSRERKAAARRTAMSSDGNDLTRSAPTVSCRSTGKGDLQLRLRRHRQLATSTGSRRPGKNWAQRGPPKPPTLPSTSGPCVLETRSWILRFTRLTEVDVDSRRGRRLFSSLSS